VPGFPCDAQSKDSIASRVLTSGAASAVFSLSLSSDFYCCTLLVGLKGMSLPFAQPGLTLSLLLIAVTAGWLFHLSTDRSNSGPIPARI
jgi:hypothetical protein